MERPETVVIPAAGLGTRMRPVDPALPKELLPLAGRPLLCHALDEAVLAGMTRAVLVIRPGKEDLRRLVEAPAWAGRRWPAARESLDTARSRLEFVFLVQERPLGEADAMALAEEAVARGRLGGRPLAAIYPDNVAVPPGALDAACRAMAATGRDSVALMRVPRSLGRSPDREPGGPVLADSGRVDLERAPDSWGEAAPWRIRAFLPKGPGAFRPRLEDELRTCGVFAALPHWFDATRLARQSLQDGQELTDGKVRRALLEAGVEFAGAPVPGTVHDCGLPAGYAACKAALEGTARRNS